MTPDVQPLAFREWTAVDVGIPKLRVLVVGNDSVIDDLLVCLRTSLECDVFVFHDAVIAARWLEQRECDVAFIDAELPDQGAFELARAARHTINRGAPVVMIPGSDTVGTLSAGKEAGVAFFVPKPLTRRNVLCILRFVAGAIETRQKLAARDAAA